MSSRFPDDNDRLDIYQDAGGEWRWRLKAGNGQIIADSGEGYETKAGALRASGRVFPFPPGGPTAPVVTPAPAPIAALPWKGLILLLVAFALGFLLGWLLGQDDDADRGRDTPSVTTTEVESEEGTIITDGTTSVLKNETTTSFPESPSGDPPTTSTTEAP